MNEGYQRALQHLYGAAIPQNVELEYTEQDCRIHFDEMGYRSRRQLLRANSGKPCLYDRQTNQILTVVLRGAGSGIPSIPMSKQGQTKLDMQPTFQAYSLANKTFHNSNDWFNTIKNKNEI